MVRCRRAGILHDAVGYQVALYRTKITERCGSMPLFFVSNSFTSFIVKCYVS
jgi:hypothetical protein